MPKTESTNVTKSVDSKGKVTVKATTNTSISNTTKSYHERFRMDSLLSMPVFMILFLLFIFGTTIMYFDNHKSTYLPGGNTYVQYTDQDLIDMQLDMPITELNNHSLREVFEDILIDWNRQLPNDIYTYQQRYDNGAYVLDRYVQEVTLTSGMITSLSTTYTNIDVVSIAVGSTFTNWIYNGVGVSSRIQSTTLYSGFVDNFASPSTYDNVANVNKNLVQFTSGNILSLAVAKGTYANLAAAQSVLAGTKIWYQLATPILNVWSSTLTVSQMDYWYEVYQDIKNGNVHDETRLALGTIDPNTGRDFYFLETLDYVNLGNNIKQGFKGLATTIKATSNLIGDVSDFINKSARTIGEFYDKAYDFMGGGSIDSIWAETQNIWKWITGKGWAIK